VKNALDIAEVAAETGISASTLRYYEEIGLIESIGRRGLRRLFAPAIIERLALITMGKSSGFSLDEIARMFEAKAIDRNLLASNADELDATIRELTRMRDGLRHAAACSAPTHFECPKFRRLLRATARSMAQRRSRAD
jgi:DNA-binding transcriptional MerR regulator